MKRVELKHEFNTYIFKGRSYYGGNQMLSEDKSIKKCGCGIIAATDLFLYMHRYHASCHCPAFDAYTTSRPIPAEDFNIIYKRVSRYFAFVSPFGISGILLALGINAFFLRHKYPFYARWGVLPSRLWSSIEEMLERDLPVIIAVGPDFPRIWQKHSAEMFSETAAGYTRSTKVRAHFMTLTALDEAWLYLSSWGKKYRIKREDYAEFVRCYSSSLASNIIYIIPLE